LLSTLQAPAAKTIRIADAILRTPVIVLALRCT
jgi:hypothetical protein